MGRPEPDNFITNSGRCFKDLESIVETTHYKIKQKKSEQQTEEKMLEVTEVYLEAAPSQDSICLWIPQKVKDF